MTLAPRLLLVFTFGIASACSQDAPAPAKKGEEAAGPKFLRFVDLGDYRGRLEAAIARYVHRDRGLEVDLISAVHIGEASYYAELSRRLRGYDAVLYELVAPEGARPARDAADDGFNPVSMLQRGLKRMLDLDFQLEGIDYEAENFVHADLSARDLARKWEERGETMISALFKMMTKATRIAQERYDEAALAREEAGEDEAAEPEKPRGREGKRRAMKWTLASQIGPMEEMLAMFGDDDKASGSVLIGARNKKAIEVLEREIGAGRKKLAIFYGAGHMPDMAARLEALGFQRTSEEWLLAWDIDSEGKGKEKR